MDNTNLIANIRYDVLQLTNRHYLDCRVSAVLDFAVKNRRDDLSLRRLASIANISVWHLCRIFKAEAGMSPSRAVKIVRIHCAMDLLASSFLSVKEIANISGFKGESHFINSFIKIVGRSPKRYRQLIWSDRKITQNDNVNQQMPNSRSS